MPSRRRLTVFSLVSFERLAARGFGTDVSREAISPLHARFSLMTQTRENWASRNASTVVPGPGRVVALSVILNQVTADMLQCASPECSRQIPLPLGRAV